MKKNRKQTKLEKEIADTIEKSLATYCRQGLSEKVKRGIANKKRLSQEQKAKK